MQKKKKSRRRIAPDITRIVGQNNDYLFVKQMNYKKERECRLNIKHKNQETKLNKIVKHYLVTIFSRILVEKPKKNTQTRKHTKQT